MQYLRVAVEEGRLLKVSAGSVVHENPVARCNSATSNLDRFLHFGFTLRSLRAGVLELA